MSAGSLDHFKEFFGVGAARVVGDQAQAGLALAAIFLILALLEAWRPMVERPREGAGRVRTNFLLGAFNVAVAALLPLTAPAAALWAEARGVGLLNLVAAPMAVDVAATVVAASLAQYGFHRVAHAWPWLWRLHRAHHADTAVDLSTTLRNHPAELAVLIPWQCAVAVVLGASAPALAAYQVVVVAVGLWTHANLRLGPETDRRLRGLIVTPAMHHRHHSAHQPETDSNFGDVLPHWDRLFGTYDAAAEGEVARMRRGLGDAADAGSSRLIHQLREPFGRL